MIAQNFGRTFSRRLLHKLKATKEGEFATIKRRRFSSISSTYFFRYHKESKKKKKTLKVSRSESHKRICFMTAVRVAQGTESLWLNFVCTQISLIIHSLSHLARRPQVDKFYWNVKKNRPHFIKFIYTSLINFRDDVNGTK